MMVRIVDASVTFSSERLQTPLVLSSGTIEELALATATVVVEANGRSAIGKGAVYLSDLWAWPGEVLSHEDRSQALKQLCESIAVEVPRSLGAESQHPLELGLRIHHLACEQLSDAVGPPKLARALCAS